MYAEVQDIQQLSPTLIRVTLSGGTLNEFEPSTATDSYINAQFPPAGSTISVPFTPREAKRLPVEQRPRPRRFTIRRWDPMGQSLAIDFVSHGVTGYAGAWAQRAQPGDRLQFDGPGGSYRPSADVDWHLLVGDESALGAIGAALEALPEGKKALAFALVDAPGHEVPLPGNGNTAVVWLYRDGADRPERLLPEAVESAEFPPGSFDVFVHGEASETREVRRHLLAERGVDKQTASISPYWRRRHSDEDWRKVKRKFLKQQEKDVS